MLKCDLYLGDCLDVMENIPDDSVDLVLTDPPYGIKFQSHRRKIIYNKIQNDNNLNFLDSFFKESLSVMKQNTAIYVFCSWHNVDTFKAVFEKYFKLKNILIWVKNNHGSGDLKSSYAPKYEFVLYGNNGRKGFNFGRKEDVLFFDKTKNKLHPTQKPIDLLEFFINNSTDEQEAIIDPFMGSGSTGVACLNTGRNFIGIELDKEYFNISCNRIKETIEKNNIDCQLNIYD